MHRIDDPTAVPTLPAPRPPGTPGYFTGGSPGSSGFAATVVRYEFMNALQEELCAVIQAAGLTLDKTNDNQLLAALRQMLRFKLAQDTTYYISPTGNDSNDGLTPGTPLLTGQAAWNKALQIDLNNHSLTLQFANGTYTNPLNCFGAPLGSGGITISGNVSQPNLVVFAPSGQASCVVAQSGAVISVQGVSLTAHGVPPAFQNMGAGLYAGLNGYITFGNVIFEQCDWGHIIATSGGVVSASGNPYTIAAGGGSHMMATLGGNISNATSAVAMTGTPAFTSPSGFAFATTHGIIVGYGAAYSGAASGQRFRVDSGSLLDTNGGGLNFFPGSTPGVTDAATYGVYV